MKIRPFLPLLAALFGAPFCSVTWAADIPRDESTLTASGEMAPDFLVQKLDGSQVSLGSMRGKIVVLNIFSTWCPYCTQEMPYLQWMYNRQKGANFEMLAISRGEARSTVESYVKTQRLGFPVAIDPQERMTSRYITGRVPRVYLIGPSGHILYQTRGFSAKSIAEIDAQVTAIKKSVGGKRAFAWRRKNAAKIAKLTAAPRIPPTVPLQNQPDRGVYILDHLGRRRLN